jgi:hypothetical protein
VNTVSLLSTIVIVVVCYLVPLLQVKQGSGSDEEKKRIKFRWGLFAFISFVPIGYIDLASRQVNGLVNVQSLASVLIKYALIWLACILVFIPFALRRGSHNERY